MLKNDNYRGFIMGDRIKLQKMFIERMIQEKVGVSIYLVNGVQLKGELVEVDEESLILKNDTVAQLIFKHAISTIVPTKAFGIP